MTPRPPSGTILLSLAAALATLWTLPSIGRALAPVDALAQSRDAAPRSAAMTTYIAGNPGAAVDKRLSVPTMLWGREAGATLRTMGRGVAPKNAADPESAARASLREVADLYRITAAEVDALPMHDLQRFPDGGAVVRFRGNVGGIEVFRENVNVLFDKSGTLVAIGGFAIGAPSGMAKRTETATADTAQAVAVALADFRFTADTLRNLAATPAEGGYTNYAMPVTVASADGSILVSARSKPVWFRLPTDLVPAVYVEVQVRDGAPPYDTDGYAYVVSATDGRVLFRHDQTVDAAFTYRVYAETTPPFLPLPGPAGRAMFPHPTATPDGTQPPLLPGNLVTLESAPFSRNDPWMAPLSQTTTGNNVEAFTNSASPDNYGPPATDECTISLPVDGDLHACLSSPGTFDHTYDFGLAPNANRRQISAAVTNMFYTINYLHDWFYDAGFDEKAGNAQTNNFNRGGAQGDSIYAEAQDFSGSNNASMFTPSDGSRPRMRMHLWSSSIALVKVNSPPPIAGAKTAGSADFGPQAFDLTADLAIALDAENPTGPTTTDGCTAYTNAAAVAGKIAVVDRGVCLFVEKAKIAQNAGAVGVLILNNVSPGAPGMSGTDATITIPVSSASQADGAAIRAQLALGPVSMRLARQSAVQREGALDNTLIAHEWGHYISNRLVGNGNGLVAKQASALGEGWADFHALLLLVKDADRALPSNANFNGTYAENAFPLGGPDFAPDAYNNAFYYGIRRYPYSRDMTKNPLTFRHITDGVALPDSPPQSPRQSSVNSEVHASGEVWASMLWECYSNLLNDTARLSFTQAQDRMKRYLVTGYKMTPTDPTFVTARDALLAAMQAQDPVDRDLCMQGFAKRGLGVGAVAPEQLSEDNSGVVESFRTSDAQAVPTAAIEYYNAGLDHYFITWVADEIAKLDNGTFKGWTRTGQSINVYEAAQGGTSAVCRIYIPPGKGDGHFFGRDTNECDGTMSKNPTFILESSTFFYLFPPNLGNCAAGQVPVYRVFSNRADANHRYTTSRATRDQMVGKGWIAEGDGADTVVMCATP